MKLLGMQQCHLIHLSSFPNIAQENLKQTPQRQLAEMGAGVTWPLALISFLLLLSSGQSKAQKPPLEGKGNMQQRISSVSATQRDEVPVVNPTTPGTANPSPTVTPTTPQAEPTTPATNPATPATQTPTSSGGAWCIANPTASPTALQVALDYACGYGGADCSAIQPGASCYNPNTVHDHASYAFNVYYQKNPVPTSCVFGGTAQLAYNDPSNGNCHYASPTTQSSMSPPANLSPPSPPTSMTPMTPASTMPDGTSIYGSEPTGSPSSAHLDSSYSLPLLLTTICLSGSLLVLNHV